MKSTRLAHVRCGPAAGAAVVCVIAALAAGCSSDAVDTSASTTTTQSSAPTATAPITATSGSAAAPTSPPAQGDVTDTDSTAATTDGDAADAAATTDSVAEPSTVVDTKYLDLFAEQRILYNPFSPDALGGDINFAEPECNKAAADLASFGAARGDLDAAGVLASLEAVGGDLPSNFPAAIDAWQAFTADFSDTYSGPFFPVSQGVLDDATLQQVLTDPDVVGMLDAFTSLELKVPGDFIGYLNSACTFVDLGVDVTTTD